MGFFDSKSSTSAVSKTETSVGTTGVILSTGTGIKKSNITINQRQGLSEEDRAAFAREIRAELGGSIFEGKNDSYTPFTGGGSGGGGSIPSAEITPKPDIDKTVLILGGVAALVTIYLAMKG